MALEDNISDFLKVLTDNGKSVPTLRKTLVKLCGDVLNYCKIESSLNGNNATFIATVLSIETSFRTLLSSSLSIALYTKPVLRIFIDAYIALLKCSNNHNGCIKNTLENTGKLMATTFLSSSSSSAAPSTPSSSSSLSSSGRLALLVVFGELLSIFHSYLMMDTLIPYIVTLMKIGGNHNATISLSSAHSSGSGSSSNSSNGSSSSTPFGLSLGTSSSSSSSSSLSTATVTTLEDNQQIPYRNASAIALYRIVESLGNRYTSSNIHQALYQHIRIMEQDPSVIVRTSIGTLLQALVTTSANFTYLSIEDCLSIGSGKLLGDSDNSVRLSIALGLATTLGCSVLSTRQNHSILSQQQQSNNTNTGGRGNRINEDHDDEDEDMDDMDNTDNTGNGGDNDNDTSPGDSNNHDDGSGSREGGGGSTKDESTSSGTKSKTSSSKSKASGSGSSFGSKAMARIKALTTLNVGGNTTGSGKSSATPDTGTTTTNSPSTSTDNSVSLVEEAAMSFSETGKTKKQSRKSSSKTNGDGMMMNNFTTTTALSYLVTLIRLAGKLAQKYNGGTATDIRIALSIAATALLRSVRGAGDGIADNEILTILAAALSSLRYSSTNSSNNNSSSSSSSTSFTPTTDKETNNDPYGFLSLLTPSVPGFHQLSILSGGIPPNGPHAAHARACILHILVHGLILPPASTSSYSALLWRKYQNLVLDQALTLLSYESMQITKLGTITITTLSAITNLFPNSPLSLTNNGGTGTVTNKVGSLSFPPLSHHGLIVLFELLTHHLLPRTCDIGSSFTTSVIETLCPLALVFLASPIYNLRMTAIETLRVCARYTPAIIPSVVATCTAAIRQAHAALATGPAHAASAAAAASTALADAVYFTTLRRSGSTLGTLTSSGTMVSNSGTGSGGSGSNTFLDSIGGTGSKRLQPSASCMLLHAGNSPVIASTTGFGIPGSGYGSGCGIVSNEDSIALIHLHGYSVALAMLIVLSTEISVASPIATLVEQSKPSSWPPHAPSNGNSSSPSPSSSSHDDDIHLARSILPGPLLMDALALSSTLFSLGRDARLSHTTNPMMGNNATVNSTSTASTIATLAQSAGAAAAAEVEAGCVRAGSMILSSLCHCGPAWITSSTVWPVVMTLLSEDILRAYQDIDTSGIGSARDGTGAYLLSPLGISPPVAAATSLILSSSSSSSGTVTGSNPSTGANSSSLDSTSMSNGADSLGLATARSIYCGIEGAWVKHTFSSIMLALLAVIRTVNHRISPQPTVLTAVNRLFQLSYRILTSISIAPGIINEMLANRTQHTSNSARKYQNHDAAQRLFNDATKALLVRIPSGLSITLGPHATFPSDTSHDGTTDGSFSTSYTLPSPSLIQANSALPIPVVRGISYTIDDASLYSPCGVSLAAIALARRSVIQATTCLLEASTFLPSHVTLTLPLRGPMLSTAVSVLTGGSLALVPLEMGLVATEDSIPTGNTGTNNAPLPASFTNKKAREPRALPTLHDATYAEYQIQQTIKKINIMDDTYSPLTLALSHNPIPQAHNSLLQRTWKMYHNLYDVPLWAPSEGDNGNDNSASSVHRNGTTDEPIDSIVLNPVQPSLLCSTLAIHSNEGIDTTDTEQPSSLLPRSVSLATDPNYDKDYAYYFQYIIPRPQYPAIDNGTAYPPNSTIEDIVHMLNTVKEEEETKGSVLENSTGRNGPNSHHYEVPPTAVTTTFMNNHPLQSSSFSFAPVPLSSSSSAALRNTVNVALHQEFTDATKYPLLGLGLGSPSSLSGDHGAATAPVLMGDPGQRSIHAAISILCSHLPYLPLGTANALVTALGAPLRETQKLYHLSTVDSTGTGGSGGSSNGGITVGYRYGNHSLTLYDRDAVIRNIILALYCCLRNLRPEFIIPGTGNQASDDHETTVVSSSSSSSGPVPWILTLRSLFALGIVYTDPVVRKISGESLAELCKLGGESFSRKMILVLQKQLTAVAVPPSSSSSNAIPSTPKLNMDVGPVPLSGIIYTIACIARINLTTQIQNNIVNEVILKNITHSSLSTVDKDSFAGFTASVTKFFEKPYLSLASYIDENLVYEAARKTVQPLRTWGLTSWLILVQSTVQQLEYETYRYRQGIIPIETLLLSIIQFRKYLQPSLNLLELHSTIASSPYDIPTTIGTLLPYYSTGRSSSSSMSSSGNGNTTVGTKFGIENEHLPAFVKVSLGKGIGAQLQSVTDIHNFGSSNSSSGSNTSSSSSVPISPAMLYSSRNQALYGTWLPGNGCLVVGDKFGGPIAASDLTDTYENALLSHTYTNTTNSTIPPSVASISQALTNAVTLPLFHPSTGELVPPSLLIGNMETLATIGSSSKGKRNGTTNTNRILNRLTNTMNNDKGTTFDPLIADPSVSKSSLNTLGLLKNHLRTLHLTGNQTTVRSIALTTVNMLEQGSTNGAVYGTSSSSGSYVSLNYIQELQNDQNILLILVTLLRNLTIGLEYSLPYWTIMDSTNNGTNGTNATLNDDNEGMEGTTSSSSSKSSTVGFTALLARCQSLWSFFSTFTPLSSRITNTLVNISDNLYRIIHQLSNDKDDTLMKGSPNPTIRSRDGNLFAVGKNLLAPLYASLLRSTIQLPGTVTAMNSNFPLSGTLGGIQYSMFYGSPLGYIVQQLQLQLQLTLESESSSVPANGTHGNVLTLSFLRLMIGLWLNTIERLGIRYNPKLSLTPASPSVSSTSASSTKSSSSSSSYEEVFFTGFNYGRSNPLLSTIQSSMDGLIPCYTNVISTKDNTSSSSLLQQALAIGNLQTGVRSIGGSNVMELSKQSSEMEHSTIPSNAGLVRLSTSFTYRTDNLYRFIAYLRQTMNELTTSSSSSSSYLKIPGFVTSLGSFGDILVYGSKVYEESTIHSILYPTVPSYSTPLTSVLGVPSFLHRFHSLFAEFISTFSDSSRTGGLIIPSTLNNAHPLTIDWTLALCDIITNESSKSLSNTKEIQYALQVENERQRLARLAAEAESAKEAESDFAPSKGGTGNDEDDEDGGNSRKNDKNGGKTVSSNGTDTAPQDPVFALDSELTRLSFYTVNSKVPTDVRLLFLDTNLWRHMNNYGKLMVLDYLITYIQEWGKHYRTTHSTTRNNNNPSLSSATYMCLNKIFHTAYTAISIGGDMVEEDDNEDDTLDLNLDDKPSSSVASSSSSSGAHPTATTKRQLSTAKKGMGIETNNPNNGIISLMKLKGTQLLEALVIATSTLPDPEVPSTSFLSQHQANIITSISSNFSLISSSPVIQYVSLSIGLRCIMSGIASDPAAVRRIMKLILNISTDAGTGTLTAASSSSSSTVSLSSNFLASETVLQQYLQTNTKSFATLPRHQIKHQLRQFIVTTCLHPFSSIPIINSTIHSDQNFYLWMQRILTLTRLFFLALYIPSKDTVLFEKMVPDYIAKYEATLASHELSLICTYGLFGSIHNSSPSNTNGSIQHPSVVRLSTTARTAILDLLIPILSPLLLAWTAITQGSYGLRHILQVPSYVTESVLVQAVVKEAYVPCTLALCCIPYLTLPNVSLPLFVTNSNGNNGTTHNPYHSQFQQSLKLFSDVYQYGQYGTNSTGSNSNNSKSSNTPSIFMTILKNFVTVSSAPYLQQSLSPGINLLLTHSLQDSSIASTNDGSASTLFFLTQEFTDYLTYSGPFRTILGTALERLAPPSLRTSFYSQLLSHQAYDSVFTLTEFYRTTEESTIIRTSIQIMIERFIEAWFSTYQTALQACVGTTVNETIATETGEKKETKQGIYLPTLRQYLSIDNLYHLHSLLCARTVPVPHEILHNVVNTMGSSLSQLWKILCTASASPVTTINDSSALNLSTVYEYAVVILFDLIITLIYAYGNSHPNDDSSLSLAFVQEFIRPLCRTMQQGIDMYLTENSSSTRKLSFVTQFIQQLYRSVYNLTDNDNSTNDIKLVSLSPLFDSTSLLVAKGRILTNSTSYCPVTKTAMNNVRTLSTVCWSGILVPLALHSKYTNLPTIGIVSLTQSYQRITGIDIIQGVLVRETATVTSSSTSSSSLSLYHYQQAIVEGLIEGTSLYLRTCMNTKDSGAFVFSSPAPTVLATFTTLSFSTLTSLLLRSLVEHNNEFVNQHNSSAYVIEFINQYTLLLVKGIVSTFSIFDLLNTTINENTHLLSPILTYVLPFFIPFIYPGHHTSNDITTSNTDTTGSMLEWINYDTGYITPTTSKAISQLIVSLASSLPVPFKTSLSLMPSSVKTYLETALRNGLNNVRKETNFGKATNVLNTSNGNGSSSVSSSGQPSTGPSSFSSSLSSLSSSSSTGLKFGSGGGLKFDTSKFKSASTTVTTSTATNATISSTVAPSSTVPTKSTIDVNALLSGEDDFLAAARVARAQQNDSDDDDDEEEEEDDDGDRSARNRESKKMDDEEDDDGPRTSTVVAEEGYDDGQDNDE